MDNILENIPVIVQYSGHWDDSLRYIEFEVFGFLMPNNCSYSNLVSMICNELKLQPESTYVKIEYQVKEGYPPFKIVDDQHVKFYIELKKKEADFTIYPLCLTIETTTMQLTSFSNKSCLTTSDVDFEVANTKGMSCNISHYNSDEVSKEVVEDYVDYAEQLSRQMLDMSPEVTTDEESLDISEEAVISNKQNQELALFQIYRDKETLQMDLSLYAIKNNFQYRVNKSCKKEFLVKCLDENCNWLLRASRNGKTDQFIIRKFSKKEFLVKCLDENCNWLLRASRNGKTDQFIIRKFSSSHTCSLDIRFKDKRQATTSVIADVIKHKFTNIKTRYSVADIIIDMKHDHNVDVKYNKAWRSKEKDLEIVRGNSTESFAELYTYLYMMYTTNAGSIVELQLTRNNCFQYVFFALNSSIKGWSYCLPVVVVDGTFLKSAYGGTLLVAATQDAGGKIFPLAFGVVDSENDLSWEWFFEKFKKAYGGREDMVIVSDRHESIIKGANKVYPEVPNVFCIFHLIGNIKSKFKKNSKKIKDAFFSAANAYTLKKFEYHMKELEKVDKRVQVYLEEVGYDKWVKVYSTNNRYSNMTSNVVESLNVVTISIRELPICTMLESLRALIQKWSWRNRNEANATCTRLTSKYEDLLKKSYMLSVDLTVHPTNHILFEVLAGDRKNVVDLSARSCTCKRFEMDRIPCAHDIAVFQKCKLDPYDYCSPYYKKETMLAAYKETVHPVGNKDTWEVPETIKSLIVYPPEGRIRVGRPKKRRCKIFWERNAKTLKLIKCSKCNQNGHNMRTCRNPRVDV